MSVIKVKDENGEFVEIPVVKGSNGKDGTSVICIKVENEQKAIEESTKNPNNIYFW